VAFTPAAVSAAGATTSVEEILAGPLGPAATPMLQSSPVCVAQYLPKALTVSDAAVVGDRLVVTASGEDVRLTALGSKGTCEAPAA
jgi:hypothetical protein